MKRMIPSAPRLLLGAAVLLTPAAAHAQMTISQARAAGAGATITVRGTVTNGPELGAIRYLQDAAAGLAAYSATQFAAVVTGDSVEITGVLKDYNGLLEIDPVSSVAVLANNRAVVPVVLTAGQASSAYAEQYESRLVRINGNTNITTSAGAMVTSFAGNTNYRLNNNAATPVRVGAASTGPTGIVGKPAPSSAFDLLGIMSQYAPMGTGGYQLLPRLYDDFVLGGLPNMASRPVATNISTTGFTVSFTTLNPGDTKLEYGTSPTNLTQQVTDGAQGTQHSLPITGLQPATVYYVRASSTNGVGTSSVVVPMITESLSSGKIRVWFTNPVNTAYAYPPTNTPTAITTRMNDSIAAVIGRAQQTLDIAIYNWNDNVILTAVVAAKIRGVRVRVISDGTVANASTAGLPSASIPEVERNTARGIMHNKFVIVDAEATNPNQPLVWTGSTNWTSGQMGLDRNSALVIQDQSLARVYQMEFEEMWGSSTATAGTPKFGPQKTDNTPHYLKIGGRDVQSWFSPSDGVNNHLTETINTADNDLHIATMLVTRSDLAQAIRSRILSQNILGCSEFLVNDTSSAGAAPWRTLKNLMGNRAQYYNRTGIMHHKYMLVDAGGADPITWVGSHNWSAGADSDNDENTLVIHDAAITNQYYQEFAKRIADQNASLTLCQLRVTGLAADAATTRLEATVYPNPAAGAFRVATTAALRGPVRVTLLDLNGRLVWETTTTATAERTVSVEAANLPAGLYHLRLDSSAGTQFGRVSVVQ